MLYGIFALLVNYDKILLANMLCQLSFQKVLIIVWKHRLDQSRVRVFWQHDNFI